MSSDAPIGIFDSGVGGLSVARHIRKRLPAETLLYVADSAHAPYGEKSTDWIRQRAVEVTSFLVARGAKAIVVACNTATAAAVEHLRKAFSLPIIAMEPAVKPAARQTRSDVIGVLATAGTLNSSRYADLLDRHGRHVRVVQRICHHWVSQVESGDLSSAAAAEMVAREVQPLLAAGADTLVLGCTHFPFLEPLIREAAGPGVSIIDPAPAVAEQLARRLMESNLARDDGGAGVVQVWSSGDPARQQVLIARISGESLVVERLPLD